ncbi:hypothetical protein MMC16_007147 [Acarospora aff. strigata]|nr:hypothetical protein [Acarospora aff. strigata]
MRSSSPSSSSTSSLVDRSGSVGFIHYGVGGAGNYRRVESTSLTALPPVPTNFRALGPFSSGIGGAGNIHEASERAMVSDHEELARSKIREKSSPSAHFIGIGGAGNRRGSRRSSASSNSASQGTEYSEDPLPIGGADMLWKKISKVFGFKTAPFGID